MSPVRNAAPPPSIPHRWFHRWALGRRCSSPIATRLQAEVSCPWWPSIRSSTPRCATVGDLDHDLLQDSWPSDEGGLIQRVRCIDQLRIFGREERVGRRKRRGRGMASAVDVLQSRSSVGCRPADSPRRSAGRTAHGRELRACVLGRIGVAPEPRPGVDGRSARSDGSISGSTGSARSCSSWCWRRPRWLRASSVAASMRMGVPVATSSCGMVTRPGSALVVVPGAGWALLAGWLVSGWALAGLIGFAAPWERARRAQRRIVATLAIGDVALLVAVVDHGDRQRCSVHDRSGRRGRRPRGSSARWRHDARPVRRGARRCRDRAVGAGAPPSLAHRDSGGSDADLGARARRLRGWARASPDPLRPCVHRLRCRSDPRVRPRRHDRGTRRPAAFDPT